MLIEHFKDHEQVLFDLTIVISFRFQIMLELANSLSFRWQVWTGKQE